MLNFYLKGWNFQSTTTDLRIFNGPRCGWLKILSWGQLFCIIRIAEWRWTVIQSDRIFSSIRAAILDSFSCILFLRQMHLSLNMHYFIKFTQVYPYFQWSNVLFGSYLRQSWIGGKRCVRRDFLAPISNVYKNFIFWTLVCLKTFLSISPLKAQEIHNACTPEPLYNTMRYNTILDIKRIRVGPQLAI